METPESHCKLEVLLRCGLTGYCMRPVNAARGWLPGLPRSSQPPAHRNIAVSCEASQFDHPQSSSLAFMPNFPEHIHDPPLIALLRQMHVVNPAMGIDAHAGHVLENIKNPDIRPPR